MSWNHRVLAFPEDDEVYFQIHSVYYNKEGEANGYGAPAANVGGDNIKDLSWTLDKMKECLEKPILWGNQRFPEEYKEESK